jgi:sugar lactone lactonase YvrE
MRRLALPTLVLVLSASMAGATLAAAFPDRLELPAGFSPEGIATGRGHTFYAGSLAGAGIVRGDYRTGETEPLVTEGGPFVGMKVDARNQLWVAGGFAGSGHVFDADTGATLATFQFTEDPSFVNDVVVTQDAAWFTDSFRAVVYRVDLGDGGISQVTFTGLVMAVPNVFRLNGIDATPDGETLVAVNSTDGELFRIDASTLDVTAIELGETLHADGILLEGHTLYAVRNAGNVAVIELAPDLSSGTIVDQLTGELDVPTTVARFGSSVYVVNARFRPPGTPPPIEFWITRLDR